MGEYLEHDGKQARSREALANLFQEGVEFQETGSKRKRTCKGSRFYYLVYIYARR